MKVPGRHHSSTVSLGKMRIVGKFVWRGAKIFGRDAKNFELFPSLPYLFSSVYFYRTPVTPLLILSSTTLSLLLFYLLSRPEQQGGVDLPGRCGDESPLPQSALQREGAKKQCAGGGPAFTAVRRLLLPSYGEPVVREAALPARRCCSLLRRG